jgi:hypothetical protein
VGDVVRLGIDEPIEAISVTEAVVNGGLFAAQGANAAHYNYDITPAIAYLAQVGADSAALNM